MIRKTVILLFAGVLLSLHIGLLRASTDAWLGLPKQETLGVTLPSPVLRIISMEFDNIVADYLFLKTAVFIGGKYQKGTGFQLDQDEWTWVNKLLIVTSDLDPYFKDPYYLANAYLVWDAGMVSEANVLLERGTSFRTWDWTLPFFSGFNYFYFLEENDKASEYLHEAAKRPGASIVLASLASKLALKANRLENSITFLEQMLERTEDEDQRKEFRLRIDALKTRLFLNSLVERYQSTRGKAPKDLEDLVRAGILHEIPQDPLGGVFFLSQDGSITSTADNRLVPKKHVSSKLRSS